MSKTHRGGGTPVYSAPELFAHLFQNIDLDSDSDSEDSEAPAAHLFTSACDIYSAGILCIVWEVVTKQEPWAAEIAKWTKKIAGGGGTSSNQIKQQLAKAVYQKGKRPKLPSDCDPLLRSVIERCWRQDPQQRPPAQAVLDELGAQAISSPAFPGGRHFQGSNFKREYERCGPPQHQHEVLRAVTEIVYGYCDLQKIADDARDDFLRRLFGEWGKATKAHEVLNTTAKTACLLVWTSQENLVFNGGVSIEFCSIFCELLRADRASLIQQAAILARGVNLNLCLLEGSATR
jgi:serine/threonine protein kinase